MRAATLILTLVVLPLAANSIIVRHDVSDAKYIALAGSYPSVCHFPDGEGTLIAGEWVLTAAHIAEGLQRMQENGRNVTVLCGSEHYNIRQFVVHPEFRPILHDIALVQLDRPVEGVQPVPLYSDRDEKSRLITIVGRGDFGTGLTGPRLMDKVKRAATNLVDDADDHWLWFDFDNPHADDVTAMEGVSGPGDSGGPAFVEIDNVTYLAGVSSHQRGDGKPGRYGAVEYYTRVSQYRDWIKGVMSGNE